MSLAAPAPDYPHALLADPEALTLRFREADATERLKLLRAAGDYYFFEEENLDIATRFYRQYVDSSGGALQILYVPESNWLLATIIDVRKEGTPHENEI